MQLESSFSVRTDLLITPSKLREIYLWGVDVRDKSGRELPDEIFEFYIKAAQSEIETYFNIKLKRQIIKESRDYVLDDYKTYGYIRCSYPVVKGYYLKGKFGEAEQISYPPEWLSSKQSNEEPEMYYRNLYLIPNIGGTTQYGTNSGVAFNGIFGANLLWRSKNYIPNYWHVRYLTGFSKVPNDLLNIIGKLASIGILNIAGDLILGAGISSFSVGLDGLSQSISSTATSTSSGFGARILSYSEDIKRVLPILENKYRGFTVSVL